MVEALCLCLAGLVFGASATAKSYPEHWFRTPDAVGLSFCEWNHYTGKSGNQQTEISCYHEKYRQGAFVDSRAEGFKTTALSLRYPNAIKTGRFTLAHGIHVHIHKVGANRRFAAWDSRPEGSRRTAYAYFVVGPGVLSQQAGLCLGGVPYPCSAGRPH